jgi:hypothetical protein
MNSSANAVTLQKRNRKPTLKVRLISRQESKRKNNRDRDYYMTTKLVRILSTGKPFRFPEIDYYMTRLQTILA